LSTRRASDVVSAWLGETEHNLANAFRRAADEDAILLLDEVDSFLQGRERARASWEITRVNELLTQMETYPGILLCATNFVETLDGAALRRFGLKVRFDYLRPEQRVALFDRLIEETNGEPVCELDRARCRQKLASLHVLTPGDFAAAESRFDLVGEPMTPAALLAALEDECRMKPGGVRTGLGFLSG
jgi:SpoVK/Ycf46/Vps4 family AAA+-type ATPase